MINKCTGIRVAGVAAAVPTKHVSPDDYIDVLGPEAIESFKKASGVMKRHMVVPKKLNGDMTLWQTASDLCCAAANKLIDELHIDRSEIGAVIMVSQSCDYNAPCTACVLQHRLGLPTSALAFDVPLGCSGYSYGVNIGASMMYSSDMKYALVLAGDAKAGGSIVSNVINSDSLLMGDSGSATLLARDENAEPLTFLCKTEGWGYYKTGVVSKGHRYPFAPSGRFYMDDLDVFNFITTNGPEIIKEYMELQGTTVDDYDCFALHQASLFSLKTVARRIKVKMDKVPLSLTQYGNTGPGSIPLTLCFQYGDTEESRNVNVLMSGFGVGLSSAAFATRLDTATIFPVFETDEWFDDGLF